MINLLSCGMSEPAEPTQYHLSSKTNKEDVKSGKIKLGRKTTPEHGNAADFV